MKIHFYEVQMYSIVFAFFRVLFFTHFSMTISVPSVLESACLGKTHFLETKFGGEHFPETPLYTLPVLIPWWVWSCQPHRRWIKSIGLLFLLHNAGNVSVLSDPQLIMGKKDCCDHGNWSITKPVASESKPETHVDEILIESGRFWENAGGRKGALKCGRLPPNAEE